MCSVLGFQAELRFQHRLGEVVSRSPWTDPALCRKLVRVGTACACLLCRVSWGPRHGLLQPRLGGQLCSGGLGMSGLWRMDLGWTPHWVPGAAPPPSPLLSLSLGLAQVVLKSGLRSVSQVGPHPKVQGSPPPLRGEHPVRVAVAYGVGALT